VLHLDDLGPATPRLPQRRLGALTQFAASASLHATLLVLAALITTTMNGRGAATSHRTDRQEPAVQRLVFLAPQLPQTGGGGGGGGNREPGRIRAAQGVGSDAITLRARRPAPTTAPLAPEPLPEVEEAPASPVLEVKTLASGMLNATGLPTVGTSSDTSTGSGSGGGVGTGTGSGLGSGHGPGVGPGSGGGVGGGVYRPGGAVSAPRLIEQVNPHYTSDALRDKIQGTVVLEAIVERNGRASHLRVLSSLDRGGLDEEAMAAVVKWRFEPGRLAGEPVDVLVTIMVDFWIR